jgi:DNA-binding XRE family transcriptional regulator
MTTDHTTEFPDDLIDFDAFDSDPALAAAIQDAQERSALRATLITARKAAGLTQKDVAAAMETTQSAVSDFERGGSDPHLSTMQRYARAVGARVVVRATVPTSASATNDTWLATVTATGYRRRQPTLGRLGAAG